MPTVYLAHLHVRLAHARHYIGITDNLDQRVKEHRASTWTECDPYTTPRGTTARGVTHGKGATLLAAANSLGIAWDIVRIWEGGYDLETRLKRTHNTATFCPLCNPKTWHLTGAFAPPGHPHRDEPHDEADIPY